MEKSTIMIVDDQPENVKLLIAYLKKSGFRISVAQSGEEAIQRVKRVMPDLVLLDVKLPGIDGFETCRRLKQDEATRDIPVIFVTISMEMVDKLAGFQAGGVDYIIKPFHHEEILARVNAHLTIRRLQQQLQAQNVRLQENNERLQLEISIRKQTEEALQASKEERNHLQKENITLRSTIQDRYKFGEIIGKSPTMQEVYQSIINASASDANVVICGESGTGKELAARTIHQLSERKEQAFVPVNCGAVPETLFEREFFGHRKGAFTGATMDKAGYFDRAHKGTLFLDEVGELDPTLQVKLLRVLQDGEYTPLGDTACKTADVRIIAATNKDLREQLRKGLIRKDFFYRIRVTVINLPPLRERKEDIPLLIEHFLSQYSKDKNRPTIPGRIVETLCAYDWPGNIRELQNELQRYLTEQRLEFTDTLDARFAVDDEVIDLGGLSLYTAMEKFEKRFITKAFEHNQGNRKNTAAMLGIDRKTLYTKLKKYGVI
jgi:formate hydrogenlyase transcriptional activator